MISVVRTLRKNLPAVCGIAAGTGLAALYVLLLVLVEPGAHVWEKLSGMWYWILALSAGFGIQAGLFVMLRRAGTAGTAPALAASGGISAGAMAACCAHHLVDLLPLLGISAAAVFLSRYQIPFIILGLLSNLTGVFMMLGHLQRLGALADTRFLKRVSRMNLRLLRNTSIGVTSAAVALAFLFTPVESSAAGIGENESIGPAETDVTETAPAEDPNEVSDTDPNEGSGTEGFYLPEIVDSRNGLTVLAKPAGYRGGEPLRFEIGFDTHQGDLDFDVAGRSVLVDDQGNRYEPSGWAGSGPGGHHRSGVLEFPAVSERATGFTLSIRDLYGIAEREFVWTLTQE